MKIMRKKFAPFGLGFPAPVLAIYLGAFFMGTAPELVLKSRKVISSKLKDWGYSFRYPHLAAALDEIDISSE